MRSGLTLSRPVGDRLAQRVTIARQLVSNHLTTDTFRRKGLVLWRPDTPLSPYPWRWCKVGADSAEHASPDKMLQHGNDESAAELLSAEFAQLGHLSLG